MCGIVGFTGVQQAAPILLSGLSKLEYRGYDSAGIALLEGDKVVVRKKKGKIANLEKAISGEKFYATTGIGHTRWATHGAPTDANAHPHISADGSIAVVHNGIIENYMELKEMLQKEHGIEFRSETDTEVIAQLLGVLYQDKKNLQDSVYAASKMMKGAYTFAAVCNQEQDRIVAFRKDTPLIAGLGEGCNFLASDVTPLLKYLDQIYLIDNGEMVVCTPNQIEIFDEDYKPVHRKPLHVNWSVEDAQKGGYQHFMLKEINEQPKAVSETLGRRLDEEGHVHLDGISLSKEDLENIHKIDIVACGTAYHAGLIGKYLIEKFAGIPVEVDIASEYRYRNPLVDEHTLFIAVSQSGETLDTLMSLREAKAKGARVLSIVNVVGSSVARESDDVFYTWAGPEIAVASTKAYTTQLICMYLLALYIGRLNDHITEEYAQTVIGELKLLPEKIQKVLDHSADIENMAKLLYNRSQVFYIGRGLDADVAYEGSLKLKEISYINSFAIAAGELKHGTIALIEPETTVIAIATQDFLYPKMYSNIEEIKARHAHIISLVKEGHEEIRKISTDVIEIPDCMDEVSPVLAIVPLQLFSYYMARERGENIDKPRNLAKSVTVE